MKTAKTKRKLTDKQKAGLKKGQAIMKKAREMWAKDGKNGSIAKYMKKAKNI